MDKKKVKETIISYLELIGISLFFLLDWEMIFGLK
jgi:hypothetical protein